MIRRRPDNAEIADALDRVADLLQAEGADAWRVRGWRGGAATLRGLERPVVSILDEEGVKGLLALPAIGKSLSAAIQEYAETGHLDLLVRLEGEVTPRALFSTVPGIGEDLARRIHEALGVETLEELELAAHDGRLEAVPGFGRRRVQGVKDAVSSMLDRAGRRRARRYEMASHAPTRPGAPAPPDVALLLGVDREYRRGAEAGRLERIAPRRFNPERQAWLPVLRVEQEGWILTASFSNTARAHELGTTNDWVVIRFEGAVPEERGQEGMATVVTERRGPLERRRVIRGREGECAAHYAAAPERPRPPDR